MAILEIPLFLPLPSHVLHAIARHPVARIELSAGPYASGGLTPSASDVSSAISAIAAASISSTEKGASHVSTHGDVVVHVMLRPRGGDFVYSASEIDEMIDSMEHFAMLGVDGVVFGILKADGDGSAIGHDPSRAPEDHKTEHTIDTMACKRLVDEARRLGLATVFHRAFDAVAGWEAALDQVAACGFNGILTAGGSGSAMEGCDRLCQMLRRAHELGLDIVVGGGVRSATLPALRNALPGVNVWHSAAILDGGEAPDEGEVRNLLTMIDA